LLFIISSDIILINLRMFYSHPIASDEEIVGLNEMVSDSVGILLTVNHLNLGA